MSTQLVSDQISEQLAALNAADARYASDFVELLLTAARRVSTSDIHLDPTAEGLAVRWRLDGVLQAIGTFPFGDAADVVARLKVLAELLTYRTDVPQEGRIRGSGDDVEMRVSTFPTLFGERAVVRLFAADGLYLYLDQLGLPREVQSRLGQLLGETSGALLVTGPAGSGKTTTVYACLRELVRATEGGRSIVSLEDPIEVAVSGVAQSQVNAAAGFDMHNGLRSLLRQDPEVILVGEIRDSETAAVAFQAALTGQLVLTTFHAGSAAESVSRLADMGIEPYLLRSGVLAIVSQRLVRRLCPCARPSHDSEDQMGLPVVANWIPAGCDACRETGYSGRVALAELLTTNRRELGQAILSRDEAGKIEQLAVQAGMVPLWQRALRAVEEGVTSAAEVRRVFGFSDSS